MKRFYNAGQPPAPSGAYAFDVSASDQSTINGGGGSDFASFLMGMGEQPGSEGNDAPNFTKDLFVAEANPYYAAFIQDTYHPTHALTITAGVRWDIFGGRTERHNRLEYFNPNAASSVNGVSYTGAEEYVGSGNRSPFTTNLKDLGPRLGFAWQPASKLVVRGGAGFYFGPSAEMVGSANLDSDGFATQTFWNATCFNADGNTVFNGSAGCGRPGGPRRCPGLHRPLFTHRSISAGRCASDQFANGAGQQSWQHAQHHVSLAAHAGDVQLQLRR